MLFVFSLPIRVLCLFFYIYKVLKVKKPKLHANGSSSLSQKTLLLKCHISRPALNSKLLLDITASQYHTSGWLVQACVS